jgi:hypothetical protein
VRYALEGSVQATGDAITINAQLVLTETGAHIWADRFEGERGSGESQLVPRLANSLGAELIKARRTRTPSTSRSEGERA